MPKISDWINRYVFAGRPSATDNSYANEVVVDDQGNLAVKVTGSNVEQAPGQAAPGKGVLIGGSDGSLFRALRTDAQGAVDTTASQREAVARAIDAIIQEIGIDNIACFLPMWETGGSELRDLIHPTLKFRVYGATPGVVGPFGSAWAFDGVNDYIEEAPAIETAAGSSDAVLDAGNKMLAQRIKFRQPLRHIAIIRLNLKRVGSPAGTLSVELREDSAGVPGSTIAATSGDLDVARVGTNYSFIGVPFDPPVTLSAQKTYWLVLKWKTPTTVDANNYVAWSYDSAGAYGEPRATYDGATWTATSGQSHGFLAYYDFLAIKEGAYIVATKPMVSVPSGTGPYRTIFSHGVGNGSTEQARFIRSPGFAGNEPSPWQIREPISPNAYQYVYRETNSDRYVIVAINLSTAASTDKFTVWWNGVKAASASGTGGQSSEQPRLPLVIGGMLWNGGGSGGAGIGGHFLGHIGAVIVTRTALTQAQIANVTRHLLTLRRYGVQGV